MSRYVSQSITHDLDSKIVLVSGPRQVGKTTLARQLGFDYDYFNWDAAEDRLSLQKKTWDRNRALVIFDELHKMPKFKNWLKGVYDTEGVRPRIIVTGSARLDIAKKMGDSLAGRFFLYRLHPFDLWELSNTNSPEVIYERLLKCSGFPEPYLAGASSFYRRWARTHTDMILRQDMLDLESVRSISQIETLIEMMRHRVGSPISYASLGRDLQVDGKTVKHWLSILENLFVLFRVPPFHRNIARAILKEPKYYFYDLARVGGDEGIKFENLVALSVKKRLDYLADTQGLKADLYFVRNKQGQEIDFYVHREDQAGVLLEAKLSDDMPPSHFERFASMLKTKVNILLVKNLKRDKTYSSGVEVRRALPWLTRMPLEEA